MNTFFGILIAIIAFGAIVTVHEFGHFFVAKLCGIKVNEFSIGMGPLLFKWGKGETQYSLRALPIGGYCAMEGEDEESDNDRAFNKKPVWKRFLVVAAGATMNIILAFVIILVSTCMQKTLVSTVVAEFDENATSAQSGLMVDDKIVEVNGRHIFVYSDITYEMLNDEDGILSMKVIRDGKKITLDSVKFNLTPDENGKNQITNDFKVYGYKKTFPRIISQSFNETISTGRLIYLSLFDMIHGKYGLNDMSGAVGVVSVITQVASYGIATLLYFIALISINIGIFNLLPFPALDGGTLVLLIIEAIRGKPIPQKYETAIKLVGFALLIALMVVVNINDVIKLIRGQL